MSAAPPFNLRRWIDQNRDLLKPPVGNKLLFEDSAFIIMAVGGPNSRKDFHHDPSEEFFFQIEGDMVLKTVQMRIPILISRSGFTAWGVELARKAKLTLIGRAKGSRFIVLAGGRLEAVGLAGSPL